MSKDYGELPLKDSQKKAFFISGAFHAAFFLFLVVQGLLTPSTQRVPKKLLVQSIALKSSPPIKTPPAKRETPAPPQEVALAEPQEEEPLPQTEKDSAPLKEEPPAQKEEPSPPKEEVIAPQPKEPPKQPAKQTTPPPKKTAPPPKTKTAQNKKAAPAKQQAAKKPAAPTYDKKLVAEAIERLNRSQKASQSSGTNRGTKKSSSTGKVSRIGAVGSLHSDTGVSSFEGRDDAPEFSATSSEGCYVTDLIRRLQLNIRLSEPGEIRIKLTLKKTGQVEKIAVVSCKNEKIKKSLLEKLRAVHFSPFGQSFRGEEEHTFLLKLSNDLSWSCS